MKYNNRLAVAALNFGFSLYFYHGAGPSGSSIPTRPQAPLNHITIYVGMQSVPCSSRASAPCAALKQPLSTSSLPADAILEEGTHPLGALESDLLNLLGLLDRPRSSLPSGSSRPRRFLGSGGRRSFRLGRHFAAGTIK